MREHRQPPLLAVRNLAVTYNEGEWNEVQVLNDLNVTLGDGDFLVLRGRNGSGKSSFVKALSGDLGQEQTAGEILLEGRDWRKIPVPKKAAWLGVIDQDPGQGTCEHLTVEEQLRLLPKPVAQRVEDRLAESGMAIQSHQRIQTLSGGQRQFLTALMAIERRPKLLLADEPTAALDVHMSPRILELLVERLKAPGMATLLVTHGEHLPEGEGVRELHIQEGKVVTGRGSPAEGVKAGV